MNVKEKFLKIESEDEFWKNKDQLKGLDMTDPEVRSHFKKICTIQYEYEEGVIHEANFIGGKNGKA